MRPYNNSNTARFARLRINDQDNMAEWSKTVDGKWKDVGGTNNSETTTTLNFHESSGGYIVMLCYAFENEPFQLYTEFVSQVSNCEPRSEATSLECVNSASYC